MILSGSKIYTILAVVAAIGLLGLSNCKPPEEPFNDTGEPVFALTGSIDGRPLQIMAGVNGYYMFTNFDKPITDSIYRFSGKLNKDSCTNCEAIEIVIGDASISSGAGLVDIDKALSSTIKFEDPSQIRSKEYTIRFLAQDSGFVLPSYSWNFGTGNDTSRLANPVITFLDSLPKNVCLTVAAGGCFKTICNEFRPFEVDKGDSVPPGFDYIVGRTVLFRNTSFGLSYQWTFGDGNTSFAYSPEHQYNSPGTYRVCLTVKTIANTHTYCKNVVVTDPIFTCVANMAYGKPSVKIIPESFISKAIVRYTADNGNIYESSQGIQPSSTFFTILSYKNYQHNEKGEKTQQVNMSFKCRVFNTNGSDFKDLEITNGVIAVAHP